MIKFCAGMEEGMLYGFGLTEGNLNRIEFNAEPIFFSFDYAGYPELWGLILFLEQYGTAESMATDLGGIAAHADPFLCPSRGVTPETLRVFPFGRDVMSKFRQTPYWAFATAVSIAHPKDQQLFFAGPDEAGIERYMKKLGLVGPSTKRTTKGFG